MEKLNVAIADDNEKMIDLLETPIKEDNELELVGHANNGADIYDIIKEKEPDVVLLDIIMPKVDGLTVMERVGKDCTIKKHPAFIVVSAVGQEQITEDAFNLGANYYVLKPFDNDMLISRIKHIRQLRDGRKDLRRIKKKFIRNAHLSAIMMLSILERSAAMAREVCMEFTCHTTYDQKALTAMARVVRKTVRAKRSRMIRVWAWVIIGLLAVSLWLSWGNIWQTAANCAVIAALLLINWKEDALNAFFAKRKALPGTDCADTTFFPDCFLVKTAAAESKWQYDKILALAETVEYLVLVMGKNYALAVEKATLAGGSLPGFRRFLEEQSGQNIQNIGG